MSDAAPKLDVRPARVGALTGLMMFVMLAPANAALLRGGEAVRSAALPTVVMAARWGLVGYYAVIALMALAVVTTLGAMLRALGDQLSGLGRFRLLPGAALAALTSLLRFEPLVSVGYPLLSWACALMLLALLFRGRDERHDAE